jgi:uncharacterized protein (DUF58 family)
MAGSDFTFPFLPRRQLVGLSVGGLRGSRRGSGHDVIGSRPYRPGDDMRAIDWGGSARVSTARDADDFIVRERYVEEAPHVVIICDHRPSMSLYGPPFPWLSKPRAVRRSVDLIVASALAERGLLGYLDLADGEPLWRPPRSTHTPFDLDHERPYSAPPDVIERAFAHLKDHRRAVPTGAFLFVLSDFLHPPPEAVWIEALEYRWDVVPVVVQDPVWEQAFPDVAGVVVPLIDPRDGHVRPVRLNQREVEGRREAHGERRVKLLDQMASLDLEPVLISSQEPGEILDAFLRWAGEREFSMLGLR